MPKPELEPCPFCGSATGPFCFASDCGDYGPVCYSVICDRGKGACGGVGPMAATKAKAIAAWNKRADNA